MRVEFSLVRSAVPESRRPLDMSQSHAVRPHGTERQRAAAARTHDALARNVVMRSEPTARERVHHHCKGVHTRWTEIGTPDWRIGTGLVV